ncbi:Dipeptide transport system permease protein DppB [Mycolicibacterium vanbaalenii]|uniref:Dipeptide transport system permease protein DppB n=1 Tax=Mycolicibacterium vanbaalenii TaxID=110539 RepID=A0A5S9R8H9_MYCVN|nr:ABC transporter permease [Mycolicibacterium vanbaalenii]CAA0133220.1 Dipeptide transport system permease protein DppB [Mycolicibacterium vanbaalenii]
MLMTLGRRFLGAVPVLLALVAVVFTLQKIAPVDPVVALVGEKAPPEVYEAAREKLGLNDPLPVQLLGYLGKALQGDLGVSTVTRTPVADNILEFLPVTLELVFVAGILIAVIGSFLGLATAQGWRGSGVLRVVMISGASVPVFLACLLAMLIFYRWLDILPVTGQTSFYDAPTGPTHFLLIDSLLAGRPVLFWDALKHLILPALCIAITPAVAVGRVLRSSLEGTMRAEYIRTARSKGIGEKSILIQHALRNAVGPVFALLGLQLAGMIGNSIVVELIFARPGIGLFIAQAISKGDFNTIAGVTLVIGVLYVLANIIVDLMQAVADPRVTV